MLFRTLLYLQIIIQMQTQLSDGNSSSNILYRPAHLLSFIKHVLEPVDPSSRKKHEEAKPESMFRLGELHSRGVEGELGDEVDSDDDTPGSEVIGADHEMIETALNLLLSILEGVVFISILFGFVLNSGQQTRAYQLVQFQYSTTYALFCSHLLGMPLLPLAH